MAGLLPQMSLEPAPGYRRFVECRLEALRRDVRRLAGDGPGVDGICTDVLAAVALWWGWFELLRVRLRRPDPAGVYLGAALARRIARSRPDEEPDRATDIAVLPAETASGWPAAVWIPTVEDMPVDARPDLMRAAVRAVPTSAAARIAAVRPVPAYTPSPAVEAVIAWLHAHETYRRYRRVAGGVAGAIAAMVLVKLRSTGAGL